MRANEKQQHSVKEKQKRQRLCSECLLQSACWGRLKSPYCPTAACAPPPPYCWGRSLLSRASHGFGELLSLPNLWPHPRAGSGNGGRRLPSSPQRMPLSGLSVMHTAIFWSGGYF
ncbi:hypothetical protein MRX96_022363 [Rhipicephalus microplus]